MYNNLNLVLVDENEQICGMWGIFKNRSDLYNYLGYIINDASYAVTVTYLAFYDSDFGSFNSWVDSVLQKDNVLCVFTINNQIFKIKISKLL